LFATLEVGQNRLEFWSRICDDECQHRQSGGKSPASAYLAADMVTA